jgi:predicted Na+-dependent transporter
MSMLQRLFFMPKDHLVIVIPMVLMIGFLVGLFLDTGLLKSLILPITILMIYPTMIGFRPSQLFGFTYGKLILISLIINFIAVPLLAVIIGSTFLANQPQLYAGLAISALLPTSNMTIAFTMLAKGNVPAAIKTTVISLFMGALLAPWFLLIMVGKYIPVDVVQIIKTVALVVFFPMLIGISTYKLLLTRYTEEHFNKNIKPLLPAVSAWGMVLIVFISISMSAHRIAGSLELVWLALGGQLAFYALNFALAVFVARKLFNRTDGLALVYSIVLRNLSISIGLAAAAFGPDAALMVTIAFLIQQQSGAWFGKLNEKFSLLPEKVPVRAAK